MQIPPLDVVVSWPIPNYDDPTTRGDALLVLLIFFSVLVFFAIIGRYYSRVVIKKWFGWDDAMISLAFIFTIGMNATVILANRKYGWDRHVYDVKPSLYQNASIVAFTAKLLFVEAATCTRLSLIFFYHRMVRDSGIEWFVWVLHASMFFVIGLGIAFTLLGIFLCVPVQAYWVFPSMGVHKCLDEGTATLIIGILNCCADLLTTILPIPLVVRLKMPVRQRFGVCMLLCLGVLVTVAGIVRTYYIWQSLINSWDETWFSYPLWICATIEIDVGVICACAPALKPLLHKPLSRVSSLVTSKVSSLRTLGTAPKTPKDLSSSTRSTKSTFRPPFARRSYGDSIWDGDEEYGILRHEREGGEKGPIAVHVPQCEQDIDSRTSMIRSRTIYQRPGGPRRQPTLEIIKTQEIEQVSYLAGEEPQGSDCSAQRAPEGHELR
ncbi:hypothetical protein DOTSEDRAFT_67641 [Dothistroma septosporum NZE10]|uniref:Rhodopsin domain-containing protein n=1 Tax=Dothistroma septosporum (strain NZE10 / CBS 128990) TaxID=675120 RepID=N1Q2H7_DOTSN|nr:hypothetical protein DOTSEDRAFT_67641 [Dothistroma septosporum NZE10]